MMAGKDEGIQQPNNNIDNDSDDIAAYVDSVNVEDAVDAVVDDLLLEDNDEEIVFFNDTDLTSDDAVINHSRRQQLLGQQLWMRFRGERRTISITEAQQLVYQFQNYQEEQQEQQVQEQEVQVRPSSRRLLYKVATGIYRPVTLDEIIKNVSSKRSSSSSSNKNNNTTTTTTTTTTKSTVTSKKSSLTTSKKRKVSLSQSQLQSQPPPDNAAAAIMVEEVCDPSSSNNNTSTTTSNTTTNTTPFLNHPMSSLEVNQLLSSPILEDDAITDDYISSSVHWAATEVEEEENFPNMEDDEEVLEGDDNDMKLSSSSSSLFQQQKIPPTSLLPTSVLPIETLREIIEKYRKALHELEYEQERKQGGNNFRQHCTTSRLYHPPLQEFRQILDSFLTLPYVDQIPSISSRNRSDTKPSLPSLPSSSSSSPVWYIGYRGTQDLLLQMWNQLLLTQQSNNGDNNDRSGGGKGDGGNGGNGGGNNHHNNHNNNNNNSHFWNNNRGGSDNNNKDLNRNNDGSSFSSNNNHHQHQGHQEYFGDGGGGRWQMRQLYLPKSNNNIMDSNSHSSTTTTTNHHSSSSPVAEVQSSSSLSTTILPPPTPVLSSPSAVKVEEENVLETDDHQHQHLPPPEKVKENIKKEEKNKEEDDDNDVRLTQLGYALDNLNIRHEEEEKEEDLTSITRETTTIHSSTFTGSGTDNVTPLDNDKDNDEDKKGEEEDSVDEGHGNNDDDDDDNDDDDDGDPGGNDAKPQVPLLFQARGALTGPTALSPSSNSPTRVSGAGAQEEVEEDDDDINDDEPLVPALSQLTSIPSRAENVQTDYADRRPHLVRQDIKARDSSTKSMATKEKESPHRGVDRAVPRSSSDMGQQASSTVSRPAPLSSKVSISNDRQRRELQLDLSHIHRSTTTTTATTRAQTGYDVLEPQQKIALRKEYGFCTECIGIPVELYSMRFGSSNPIYRNVPGESHHGTCLICHPPQPQQQEERHHRHTMTWPHGGGSTGKPNMKSKSQRVDSKVSYQSFQSMATATTFAETASTRSSMVSSSDNVEYARALSLHNDDDVVVVDNVEANQKEIVFLPDHIVRQKSQHLSHDESNQKDSNQVEREHPVNELPLDTQTKISQMKASPGTDPTIMAETILSYMRQNVHDEAIQVYCLTEIRDICNNGDTKNIESFMELKAPESIVLAMREYMYSRNVQLGGWDALWSICVDSTKTTAFANAILSIMSKNGKEETVQVHCLNIIWEMCKGSNQRNLHASFRETNAPAVIVWAMNKFKDSQRVRKSGCGAFWSLCMNGPAMTSHLVRAGACRVVVEALRDSLDDQSTQKLAMGILRTFSKEGAARQEFLHLNAAHVVLQSMEKDVISAQIQKHGCEFLCNCIMDPSVGSATTTTTTTAVSISDEEIMTAVVRAMFEHHTDAGVMSVGCLVFRQYANQETAEYNLNTLRRCEGGIEKLCISIRRYLGNYQLVHGPQSERQSLLIENTKIILEWIDGAQSDGTVDNAGGTISSPVSSMPSIAENNGN